MNHTWTLGIGSTFVYDGERCTVIELAGDAVVIRTADGRARRMRLIDILTPAAEGGKARLTDRPADAPAEEPITVAWSDATDSARAVAHERADHVREVLTGYRSGSAAAARPGEPRPRYRPEVKLMDRQRAKAEELGVGVRTIARWVAAYRDGGEAALLDSRHARPGRALVNFDTRWVATAQMILDEQASQSKVAKKIIIERINARLDRIHGDGTVPRPSQGSAYRALSELDAGRNTFTGTTKGKRSIKNRPKAPYGRLHATRPGEYVLLDTTPLNVFALAPVTGKWVRADLTVAIDLYSRCILGMRLTPVSTKSVDVSGVLLEAFQPFDRPAEWTPAAQWPYHGVPDTLLVNPKETAVARFSRAGIVPETIVVDHGKPFLSDHVTSACARLGISIQPARIYQPTDKSPVERFFRTLDTLLQELPGYKGADVAGRGADVEDEAVYTVPQLEQIIREWTASVYHLRPHPALIDPGLPGLQLSPAQRYEQGLAIAGMLHLPADRHVLMELLPVVTRQFNHYGVDIDKLRYTGDIVAKYQNRSRSVHRDRGTSWPFIINPDDLSRIFFHDPDDGTWHTLHWEHAASTPTPFSLDALEYAKHLARHQPGHVKLEDVLARLLDDWGAGRALTPTERRISARAAAQHAATTPASDSVYSLAAVQRLLDVPPGTSALAEELAGPPSHHQPAWPDIVGDDDGDDELDDPGIDAGPMDLMEDL